jgi:hypothetical protein
MVCPSFCRLVSWSIDLLVGLLAGILVGVVVSWLRSWSVGRSVGRSVGQSVGRSVLVGRILGSGYVILGREELSPQVSYCTPGIGGGDR